MLTQFPQFSIGQIWPTSKQTTYENTSRSGAVRSDERWKGLIDVTGDITIYHPATLTIEPDTTVRFAAGSDDQAGGSTTPITDPYFPDDPAIPPSQLSGILIEGGTLHAVGTADKPIVFTSSASDPKPGDWQSIAFGWRYPYEHKGKLLLQNALLEFGYYGVQINVDADDSNVIIKNNTMRHIVACGICLGSEPDRKVTITISGNDISYCGHEAIDTHSNANVIIENNTLHDNLNGVIIDGNDSTIRHNRFLRNGSGISIISKDSHPTIHDNTFVDNGTNIRWV